LKYWVKSLHVFETALLEYMGKGPEEYRQAISMYSGIQNYIKRHEGGIKGLSDKDVMARKMAQEKELIAKVKKDPALGFAKKSWKLVAQAIKENEKTAKKERFTIHQYNTAKTVSVSELAGIAEKIVEYFEQVAKPNEERKAAYRDSALESTKIGLFSSAPIYKEMEEHMFAAYLQMLKDELGEKDSFVVAALGGQSPKTLAQQLVSGTKLENVEYRKELIAGGKDAVEKSTDPFVMWVRKVDPLRKEIKKWFADNVESAITVESNKIARARFAIYGKSTYPDATNTLRLNYGTAKGYESGTTLVPYKTTFYGMYGRAADFDNKEPFNLPTMFVKNKDKVNMATPYNFVTDHDTVGGNSGSPIFNKNLEFVGLLFDGNIEGLILPVSFYKSPPANCVK
ncbi:MAG: S46 family peptidase, partial [Elusimicrobia bacterium]|nr:S46 family peptidase [Elusimicrobiota bacterium]